MDRFAKKEMVGKLIEILIKKITQNVLQRQSLFDCFQMLYAIKNTDDLGKLEELTSLQRQVKAVRLQDKLGKRNFHEVMRKVFEPHH